MSKIWKLFRDPIKSNATRDARLTTEVFLERYHGRTELLGQTDTAIYGLCLGYEGS